MILNTHYAYGAGGSGAVIVVTAPAGSTVTATLDGTVYTAQEVNGTWTFKVRKFGTYTVTATLGNQTASTTVAVTEAKTYEVTLAYTFTVKGSANTTMTSPDAYVKINGRTYGADTNQWLGVPDVVVQPNTKIAGRIASNNIREPSRVYLNNNLLTQTYDSKTFNFTVTGNVNIQWNYDGGRWTLNITMN